MSVNPKDAIGVKKAPLSLVPAAAVIAMSDALADGAAKYGPHNYRASDGVKASIYYEAALRHLFAWYDGEEVAEDSGVHHLAHAAACLAILLDTKEIGQMIDDRPTRGAAGAMLKARDKSKQRSPRFTATSAVVSDNEAPSRAGGTWLGEARLGCCGAASPRCVDCPYVGAAFSLDCRAGCAACKVAAAD